MGTPKAFSLEVMLLRSVSPRIHQYWHHPRLVPPLVVNNGVETGEAIHEWKQYPMDGMPPAMALGIHQWHVNLCLSIVLMHAKAGADYLRYNKTVESGAATMFTIKVA